MSVKPKTLLHDYHLLSYDTLDSTNDEAKRLAEGGASHGAVIWARRQTAGRGRMGREWVSEEGNLYVSFLLSPSCDVMTCAQLSFVAGVAAVETLTPILPPKTPLACKWPNDLMLGDKKVGGILLESFQTPAAKKNGDPKQWVVVGVGINVEHFPEGMTIPATCLKEAGVEIISAKIVLSRYIHHFICQYDAWEKSGFAPLRKAWLKHAWRLGEEIDVKLPNENSRGIFRGVDMQGRLALDLPKGKRKVIHAGDVFFAGE